MNIPDGMNCIHDNKVNKISQYNLLHDILNPTKHNKNRNIYYSPIIHECMNTQKGKAKFIFSSSIGQWI